MAKKLFDPKAKEPFKISRSKIELYTECPRCFYLDAKLGIGRPKGYPFTLNSAVDALLKKEFDIHRANKEPHPLMKHYGIDAVPFDHNEIEQWRNALRTGISYHHQPSNFLVFGAIDDVWESSDGKLIIVDYKATSTSKEIDMDTGQSHHQAYKREVEIYQWLFRKNGFPVSETSYFVYCNGRKDLEAFDGKLEFNITLISHKGDDSWIDPVLEKIRSVLESDIPPSAGLDCDHCRYAREVKNL